MYIPAGECRGMIGGQRERIGAKPQAESGGQRNQPSYQIQEKNQGWSPNQDYRIRSQCQSQNQLGNRDKVWVYQKPEPSQGIPRFRHRASIYQELEPESGGIKSQWPSYRIQGEYPTCQSPGTQKTQEYRIRAIPEQTFRRTVDWPAAIGRTKWVGCSPQWPTGSLAGIGLLVRHTKQVEATRLSRPGWTA